MAKLTEGVRGEDDRAQNIQSEAGRELEGRENDHGEHTGREGALEATLAGAVVDELER